MSAIGQRLAQRYELARIEITIPEMDSVFPDGRLYCKPMTVGTLKRLQGATNIGDPESSVDVLIALAEDAEGRPFFGPGDRGAIMNYFDSTLLARVVDTMLGQPQLATLRPSEDEAPPP